MHQLSVQLPKTTIHMFPSFSGIMCSVFSRRRRMVLSNGLNCVHTDCRVQGRQGRFQGQSHCLSFDKTISRRPKSVLCGPPWTCRATSHASPVELYRHLAGGGRPPQFGARLRAQLIRIPEQDRPVAVSAGQGGAQGVQGKAHKPHIRLLQLIFLQGHPTSHPSRGPSSPLQCLLKLPWQSLELRLLMVPSNPSTPLILQTGSRRSSQVLVVKLIQH